MSPTKSPTADPSPATHLSLPSPLPPPSPPVCPPLMEATPSEDAAPTTDMGSPPSGDEPGKPETVLSPSAVGEMPERQRVLFRAAEVLLATPRLDEKDEPLTPPAVEVNPPSPEEGSSPQLGVEKTSLPALVLPDDGLWETIKPAECGDELPLKWADKTKWMTLCVIFLVQVSMNLNTTLYSNGIKGISDHFSVTVDEVRWGGAASFLIAYAFGCELWAPWSEEYGRRWVLQGSLFLVNCFAIMTVLAPIWPVHILGRTLGGLASAGGSVTLAVVSDMFNPDDPMFQHATSFIVLSSVGGSIIGPMVGGVFEEHGWWQWCIWIQIIVGFAVQALHFAYVRETRAPIVMDKVAKARRKSGKNPHLRGPTETSGKRGCDWAEVGKIWVRPFWMFLTEPIVLCFSLLSGFSDALIFMMIQSFGYTYSRWHFSPVQTGLAFIPFGIGYLIAYGAFFVSIRHNVSRRKKNPNSEYHKYESRLCLLVYLALLLPFGLLMFAFGSAMRTHWSVTMAATCMIGVANFAIYMATIDYVLRAYGPYAASATGGNGWARDFLAGILTPFAVPMYEKLGIFDATMLLMGIASVFYLGVLAVYFSGHWLRQRSKFAQTIARAAVDQEQVAISGDTEAVGEGNEDDNVNHVLLFLTSENLPGSRAASPATGNTPVSSPRSSMHLRPSISQLHLGSPGHPHLLHQTQAGVRQHSHLATGWTPLEQDQSSTAATASDGEQQP